MVILFRNKILDFTKLSCFLIVATLIRAHNAYSSTKTISLLKCPILYLNCNMSVDLQQQSTYIIETKTHSNNNRIMETVLTRDTDSIEILNVEDIRKAYKNLHRNWKQKQLSTFNLPMADLIGMSKSHHWSFYTISCKSLWCIRTAFVSDTCEQLHSKSNRVHNKQCRYIEGLITEFQCVTMWYGIECSFLVIMCYYHQKAERDSISHCNAL